jgi:TDG/mug DNA glycosylase family protein
MKGFKPIVNASSRMLILGTFPSKDSLKVNQYYANATNLFWPLIFAVLEGSDEETVAKRWNATTSYKDKIQYALSHGVALWDVLRSCERKTSADRDILNAKPNNFRLIFKKYPNIKTIAFNGGGKQKNPRPLSAAGLYKFHIGYDEVFDYLTLYSSSSEDRNKLDFDSLFLKKYHDWKNIQSNFLG